MDGEQILQSAQISGSAKSERGDLDYAVRGANMVKIVEQRNGGETEGGICSSSGWSSLDDRLEQRLRTQRLQRRSRQLAEVRGQLRRDATSADMRWSLFYAAVMAAAESGTQAAVECVEPWPHWFIDLCGQREIQELVELLHRSPNFRAMMRTIMDSSDNLTLEDDVLGLLYWVLVVNVKPHMLTMDDISIGEHAIFINTENYINPEKLKIEKPRYVFQLLHSPTSTLLQKYNGAVLENDYRRFRAYVSMSLDQLHNVIHQGIPVTQELLDQLCEPGEQHRIENRQQSYENVASRSSYMNHRHFEYWEHSKNGLMDPESPKCRIRYNFQNENRMYSDARVQFYEKGDKFPIEHNPFSGLVFTRNLAQALQDSPLGSTWHGSGMGCGFRCVLVCTLIDDPDKVRRHIVATKKFAQSDHKMRQATVWPKYDASKKQGEKCYYSTLDTTTSSESEEEAPMRRSHSAPTIRGPYAGFEDTPMVEVASFDDNHDLSHNQSQPDLVETKDQVSSSEDFQDALPLSQNPSGISKNDSENFASSSNLHNIRDRKTFRSRTSRSVGLRKRDNSPNSILSSSGLKKLRRRSSSYKPSVHFRITQYPSSCLSDCSTKLEPIVEEPRDKVSSSTSALGHFLPSGTSFKKGLMTARRVRQYSKQKTESTNPEESASEVQDDRTKCVGIRKRRKKISSTSRKIQGSSEHSWRAYREMRRVRACVKGSSSLLNETNTIRCDNCGSNNVVNDDGTDYAELQNQNGLNKAFETPLVADHSVEFRNTFDTFMNGHTECEERDMRSEGFGDHADACFVGAQASVEGCDNGLQEPANTTNADTLTSNVDFEELNKQLSRGGEDYDIRYTVSDPSRVIVRYLMFFDAEKPKQPEDTDLKTVSEKENSKFASSNIPKLCMHALLFLIFVIVLFMI